MSRQAMFWQLAFDAAALLALLVLAWTGRRRSARPAKAKKPFFSRRARTDRTILPAVATPAPAALEDLVGAAEQREEMLAEAALRQRLERFRHRAAG